ncbi:MAG: hypothetical protein AABY75_05490 [Bacteroidota bacterium]
MSEGHEYTMENRCCLFCNEWKLVRSFYTSGSAQNSAICDGDAGKQGYVWGDKGWEKKPPSPEPLTPPPPPQMSVPQSKLPPFSPPEVKPPERPQKKDEKKEPGKKP